MPFKLQSISEFNLILNYVIGLSSACLFSPRTTRHSTTYYMEAIHAALKTIRPLPNMLFWFHHTHTSPAVTSTTAPDPLRPSIKFCRNQTPEDGQTLIFTVPEASV